MMEIETSKATHRIGVREKAILEVLMKSEEEIDILVLRKALLVKPQTGEYNAMLNSLKRLETKGLIVRLWDFHRGMAECPECHKFVEFHETINRIGGIRLTEECRNALRTCPLT